MDTNPPENDNDRAWVDHIKQILDAKFITPEDLKRALDIAAEEFRRGDETN